MAPLGYVNWLLAPFGKRVFKVRARSGVVRYALGPEFAQVWTTLRECYLDLGQLRAFKAVHFF